MQCRWCGFMTCQDHLRRHVKSHNKRYGKLPSQDIELADGEWVIKPYWTSKKEQFDPKPNDDFAAPEYDADAELPRFLVSQMILGFKTPWPWRRHGQVAHGIYFERYQENPTLKKSIGHT